MKSLASVLTLITALLIIALLIIIIIAEHTIDADASLLRRLRRGWSVN